MMRSLLCDDPPLRKLLRLCFGGSRLMGLWQTIMNFEAVFLLRVKYTLGTRYADRKCADLTGKVKLLW